MTTTSIAASYVACGVKPVIARRRTEHGSGLGSERSVVERSFACCINYSAVKSRDVV
jgi:hypothetical protein